jgi:hypothetical protein
MAQSNAQDLEQCIDNCQQCHEVCLRTVNYCLQKGGRHAEPAHIRLMLDCIEICETSANSESFPCSGHISS